MLKKSHRLTRQQFSEYFTAGRRIHTPHFTIITAPADQFHGAVVVGKKVYKKAVDRNRCRRRVYGTLYRWQQRCGATGVYIIIAKPTAADLSQSLLAPTVTEALLRVAQKTTSR